MSQDALAKAREIAARLSGGITGSDLGKRKNRWDEDNPGSGAAPGLGSIKRKKIYIPFRDHPDINFLGLLIGPKGVTQKQMQEMSGAKIIIRGKGASKDGGPSNTGHPDDTDELHVSIEGSDEAVGKASKEVEQILYNPEQASRLKTEQLKHLAEMQGVPLSSIAVDTSSAGGNESYQIELRVPNNMVGLIIGKGGENILRIQMTLNVTAQIAKEQDMLPGETLRSIILKGTPDNVAEAKRRIDEIINAQLLKNSGAAPANNTVRELENAFVVKLPVPNDKVGIIIGKGGMTIKGIQERTRATVQIPVGPDEEGGSVRTLSIGGDTKEAVDAAQMEIFMALQMQQQQAQQAYNSSANALQVVVPDDKVGIIIGKGGVTVKDIQNRLGVKVQIPQAADLGSMPPVRTLSIVGPQETQPQAKYEIEMIVAGTPVNGGSGANTSQYQYGAASGAGAMYGMGQQQQYGMGMGSYYGAPAAAAPQYGMQYGMNGYYGQQQAAYGGQPAYGGATQAAAGATETPTDPTAYYNDFWQYAQYYGEAAARVYYGAWSPPEGTPPPAGIVVPASAPAGQAAATQASTPKQYAQTATAQETNGGSAAADNESAAAAWEAYKKQYAEWYEAHGKAAGADPNPPAM